MADLIYKVDTFVNSPGYLKNFSHFLSVSANHEFPEVAASVRSWLRERYDSWVKVEIVGMTQINKMELPPEADVNQLYNY